MTRRRREKADVAIDRLREDPALFAEIVLGVPFLTPDQLRVLAALTTHPRVGVTAGHGVGKTFLAGIVALWFLVMNPDSRVVTTAPTWHQVENLLWREIARLYHSALVPLGGKLNKTDLELGPEWLAYGLSTTKPTRFQGAHAPRVLLVFDEATGVDAPIWEAGRTLVVGDDDRWLAIGNPTDPTSQFRQACDSDLWHHLRISSEDHPNVLEDRVLVPGAVTRRWIAESVEEYGGRETDLYRARVLGLWPAGLEDLVIPLPLWEAAAAEWTKPRDGGVFALGVDVARFGDDETVLYGCDVGGNVFPPLVRKGRDLMDTCGLIARLNPTHLVVDDTGLGGGLTDRLREIGFTVHAETFGAGAIESDRFFNRRSEMYLVARDCIRDRKLKPSADKRTLADFAAVSYGFDSKGRIKLLPKEEIKKRIGRSPDRADGFVLLSVAYSGATIRQAAGASAVEWATGAVGYSRGAL